ncbi:MAG: hypothetical protein ACLTXW_11785 [Christensenellales bacterium]
MRVLLKDGSVLEQGKWKQTDVAIENGVIVARGEQLSFPAEKVFDCRGFALFPGFVDVHVHLREPGFSYKGRPLRPAARHVRTADIRPSARCRI